MRSKGLFAFVLVMAFAFALAGQGFGAIIRVKWDSPTNGTGGDWDSAYHTVVAAMFVSRSGDEVWVARGTYVEHVSLKSGVALYGGFAGSETSRDQRDFGTNVTVLDGNQVGSVVTSLSSLSSSTRIDGFTVRNGKSTSSGGGINCSGSPTIANNTIVSNVSDNNGGGIYAMSSATICNNFIGANSAYNYGGGVYIGGGSPVVANNTIAGNTAQNGGGLSITASAAISNNIVAFNSSGLYTGGTPVLRNNCVYNPEGYNYSGVAAGVGDIQADPHFVSLGFADLHIQPGSPCIDAGYDTAVQTGWLDIDGQTRIQGAHVDIGADECDGVARTFTPTVVRVSPTGDDANDGSTWALAKRTVEAGIGAARKAEVWVAAGTYTERITLANLVFVYGGFAGTEVARSDRDLSANRTILDGSAGGSVVTAQKSGQRTSGVDGFTIRNGSAAKGGGIYCYAASPVIANNLITANSTNSNAQYCGGGGICCYYASPVISGNTITANSALGEGGGGIYCYYSSPAISGNTLARNSATGGGAIYCTSSSSPVISGNTVTDNTSNSGGAVLCRSTSLSTVSNNTIRRNSAYGIECDGPAIVSGNLVESNADCGIQCSSASVYGNTVRANGSYGISLSYGTANVLNNTITANVGGISCDHCAAVIANNVIGGNSISNISTSCAGGILCNGCSPTICNNTITGNTTNWGPAIFCSLASPTISNNIIAFNSGGIMGYTGTVLRNNCIYNPGSSDYLNVSPGTGDIQVDPGLVAVGHGEVHLQPGSRCIDAGYDAAVQPGWTDIDGQARTEGAHVDIGADECDGIARAFTPAVIRVGPNGNDGNDGSSWALAKRTVQAGALAASAQSGEVWVAAGTYNERILLPAYAYLYGGFAGGETDRAQRDFTRNTTVLDGGAGGCVVQAQTGDKVTASGIDGFTIRNGKSCSSWPCGGVSCSSSSPSVCNNTITANVGCGVYLYKSESAVQGNTISGNTATATTVFPACGGGVYCFTSNSSISSNVITANSATDGAGIYCWSSLAVVSDNTITANVASDSGGGINSSHSTTLTLRNNTIRANTAAQGAGIYSSGYDTISGNTIVGNNAIASGAGIYCSGGAWITNNTIVNNSASGDGGAVYGYTYWLCNNICSFNSSGICSTGSSLRLRNNCVYNPAGYNYSVISAGAGDISLDPMFVNLAGGDYHLKATSPCIDAGWSDATGIPTLDMDGEARLNGTVDIGADEYWLGPARCVSDAKASIDTSPVSIYGGIVSAKFADCFYIESDDRVSGVMVRKPGHTLNAGDRARVLGALATNLDSERYIEATTADSTGTGSVGPLAMPNRSIGGGTCGLQSGVWGWLFTKDQFGNPTRLWDKAFGLNNIGLLISTCGRVSGIEHPDPPALATWFTIDDGSDLNLKCIVPSGVTIEPGWQYVRVTGVASCERVGSEVHAAVKVRSGADITAL